MTLMDILECAGFFIPPEMPSLWLHGGKEGILL